MSLENFPNIFLNFSQYEMDEGKKHLYRFKSFRLDVKERQLLKNGDAVPLTPKAFDVLVALVERGGHLVEKDELLNLVWADSFVEEINVARIVHTLRKILGEDENGNKFIETVAKKGYRFVAKVTEFSEVPAPKPGNGEHHALNLAETKTADELQTSPPEAIEVIIPPAVKTNQKTRFVLFGIGFVSAVCLLLLLSFNFQTVSYPDPNEVRSIAVLPVKPINAANRDEIYEYGIADSLILRLGSMKEFIVRPLSATRKYADIEQDAITAGKEQMVDYVLASNYQLADGKIRITAQLFNVANGQIEETYTIEKDAGNIFAMQDAISGEIGNKLLARFAATSSSPMAKRGTNNEEAYRLYLQGAALADKRTIEEIRKAVEYFEQAVRLDQNYALAYARLANAQTAAVGNRSRGMDEQYPKAKAAIEKALAIDDNLSEAHSYLGEIKSDFEGDFAGAELEHKRAIELNPNSSTAHRMYALLLTYLGRHDESLAQIKTAIDLEPASVLNYHIFGRILLFARRYDEAITALERTAEMDSDFFFAHQSLSVVYRLKGDDDRAFESFVKSRILFGEKPDEISLLKIIYARLGWRGVNEREFEKEKEAEKNGKPNYNRLANLSSELNEREQAFAYLEKAIVQHGTITLLKVHPRFDGLRGDPRFDDLLRRVGF